MSREAASRKSREATAKRSRLKTGKVLRSDATTTKRSGSKTAKSADPGRAVTKARRTVTLDVDVVAELESRGGSVSAQLNEWARRGMEWDQRQSQILELVAEYEAEFGEIAEADVQRWEDILS